MIAILWTKKAIMKTSDKFPGAIVHDQKHYFLRMVGWSDEQGNRMIALRYVYLEKSVNRWMMSQDLIPQSLYVEMKTFDDNRMKRWISTINCKKDG